MTKIYQRTFDPDSGDSLALVAKQIPPHSRVLDIGCGAGDLGQYLRTIKHCYVVGLEYSEDSLALAKEKLDKVMLIDLNQQSPHELLEEKFDIIVMADILEHIYTPDVVLQSAKHLLKAQGKCVVSIPNAAYVGALLSLYDDQWQYQEEGILDGTHIRFYTKKSVMALLNANDFDGQVVDRVIKDLTQTEFTQRIDCQAEGVRDWLLAKPEGATYQLIIEARPKTQGYDFPAEQQAPTMSFQHVVKLFWQTQAGGNFVDEKYQLARGTMGQVNTLVFPIGDKRLAELRLDFADRRGVYRLDFLSVFDGDQRIWSSKIDRYQLVSSDCLAHQQLPTTCLAHRSDAFLLLRFAQPLTGDALRVEVVLQAPVDASNMAFIDSVPLVNYEKIQSEKTQVTVDYASFRQEAQGHIDYLQNTLEDRQQLLNNAIDQAKQLILEKEKIIAEKAQLVTENEQLSNEKTQLIKQLNELLASTSWKLTTPLRKVLNIMRGNP